MIKKPLYLAPEIDELVTMPVDCILNASATSPEFGDDETIGITY